MSKDIYIDKIISSLKIKLDKDNNLYRNYYEGEVILSKVEFKEPLSNKDIDNIKDLYLPEDYIEFLKISNGAELFKDNYRGSREILRLYSLDEIIEGKEFYSANYFDEKVYPIGRWLDSAELLVDEIALKNNKDYLFLADGSKTFTYGFQEFLDKFIIAQGNEFWLLDVSYH